MFGCPDVQGDVGVAERERKQQVDIQKVGNDGSLERDEEDGVSRGLEGWVATVGIVCGGLEDQQGLDRSRRFLEGG